MMNDEFSKCNNVLNNFDNPLINKLRELNYSPPDCGVTFLRR